MKTILWMIGSGVVFLLAGCAGMGGAGPGVELFLSVDGKATGGYDFNNLALYADGNGVAQLRSSDTGLPLFVRAVEKGVLLVRRREPEFEGRYKVGLDVIPPDAWDIVLAVMTAEEAQAAGLLPP